MDFHGIDMKGKYFMEEVASPTAAASNEKRIVYNTSGTINGVAVNFGANKMYYHNNTKWVRPLLANVDDGPDLDSTRILGSNSVRFLAIYADSYYGSVRYS